MFVIFPVEELLGIESSGKSNRNNLSKAASGEHKKEFLEVLPPTHPGQKDPSQQSSSQQQQKPSFSTAQCLTNSTQTSARPTEEKSHQSLLAKDKSVKGKPGAAVQGKVAPSQSAASPPAQQQVSSPPPTSPVSISVSPPSLAGVEGKLPRPAQEYPLLNSSRLQPQVELGFPRRGSEIVDLGRSEDSGGSYSLHRQLSLRAKEKHTPSKQRVVSATLPNPKRPGNVQSDIARSNSCYVDKECKPEFQNSESADDKVIHDILRSPVVKSEIPRDQIIKSDSFKRVREDVKPLKKKDSKRKDSRVSREPSSERVGDNIELKELFNISKAETRFNVKTAFDLEVEETQSSHPVSLELGKSPVPSPRKKKPSVPELQIGGGRVEANQFFGEATQVAGQRESATCTPSSDSEAAAASETTSSPSSQSASKRQSSPLARGFPSAPKYSLPSSPTTLVPAQKLSSSSYSAPFSIPMIRSTMAGVEPSFKDLTHPAVNDTLKAYNSVTFKLIKTVSEFSAHLSRLHERHAEDLQGLVETFRKKHSDLRNEKPPCSSHIFHAWETLLQEVEVDSQLHSDVSGTLVRQVSRPLIEKTFHRKIQSRKLFTHRESTETILGKTEEMLKKCRKEQTEAYQEHCRTQSNASLAQYFDAHNAYIQQLHATNAMLHEYNVNVLPSALVELEEAHVDVGCIVIDSILQGADIFSVKAQEQNKRYENLVNTCRNVDPRSDVVSLCRYLEGPQTTYRGIPQHRYLSPQPPSVSDGEEGGGAVGEFQQIDIPPAPPLRDELVLDQLAALSSRSRVDSLRRECTELERQIITLQEGMDALLRVQSRSLESSLYNKANELQEDISLKRFDLRVNQIHLAAVKAQKDLFASKDGSGQDSRDRKLSNTSTGSMKSKWMKAFKSLKTPSGPNQGAGTSNSSSASAGASGLPSGSDSLATNIMSPRTRNKYSFASTVMSVMQANSKKNGARGAGGGAGTDPQQTVMFDNTHIFQEYTFKKITACDVCQQILRGHSRQGMKCRLCKSSVHLECMDRAPKCKPKSRLLRRQRSTSEIESKQMIDTGEEEGDTLVNLESLISSQPGRRMRADPVTPSSVSSSGSSSMFPFKKAPSQGPCNTAGRNPL